MRREGQKRFVLAWYGQLVDPEDWTCDCERCQAADVSLRAHAKDRHANEYLAFSDANANELAARYAAGPQPLAENILPAHLGNPRDWPNVMVGRFDYPIC